MPTIFRFLLYVLTLLPAFNASAQLALSPQKDVTQYQIDYWKKQQGLPQNSVLAITQDRLGYLWVATYGGLGRFNGINFQRFTSFSHPEIVAQSFTRFFAADDASLWTISNGNGLVCRDTLGNFTHYGEEVGLPEGKIHDFLEASDGTYWVASDKGLFKGTSPNSFQLFSELVGLPGGIPKCLLTDQQGTLWVGTNNGLARAGSEGFWTVPAEQLPSPDITVLHKGKDGTLWVGTRQGLAYRPALEEDFVLATENQYLPDRQITALLEDNAGNLWIGTRSGGLVRRSSDGRIQTLNTGNGLPVNHVKSLYQDHEGSLWVGLNRGGLVRLRDARFARLTTHDGLPTNIINCLWHSQQKVWVGTHSHGLLRYSEESIEQVKSLAQENIRTLYEASPDSLWVGTYTSGAFLYRPSLHKAFPLKDPEGLLSATVRGIIPSENGGIWIAHQKGVSLYRNGEFMHNTQANGLFRSPPLCLLEDVEGALWAGTDGRGLVQLTDTKVLEYRKKDGLRDDLVLSLYEGAGKVIWIGTRSGLSCYLPNEKRFVNRKLHFEYLNTSIHQIIGDKAGRLWLTSNNGVMVINEKALLDFFLLKGDEPETLFLDETDGMPGSDCAASAFPAGRVDQEGNVWIPTTQGIGIISPEDVNRIDAAPELLVSGLQADDKPQNLHKPIVLSGDVQRIELYFDALSFIAPEKISMRYRLLPLEKEWNYEAGIRRVVYTSLPPSQYTFEVQAATTEGEWGSSSGQLSFELVPRFYERPVFWGGAVLLIIFLVVFAFRWRTRLDKRKQLTLERQVKSRTDVLVERNKELQKNTKELKAFDAIVENINRARGLNEVVYILLEQGTALLKHAEKGFFLAHHAETDCFELLGSYQYTPAQFNQQKKLSFNAVNNYCRAAQRLNEGQEIYELTNETQKNFFFTHHALPYLLLFPIVIKNDFKGIFFFEFTQNPNFKSHDYVVLERFRKHSLSAFSKAETLNLLNVRNHELEDTVNKLKDSIQYAQRLQRAFMPPAEEALSPFRDAFIFYQPKDVVSGDFYWTAKTETHILLAAVDCTGHGVPGAIMTVLANSILNQIFEQYQETNPAKILHLLDDMLAQSFGKDSEKTRQDGMDMAIVSWEKDTNQLHFAGAKNPICRVRDGEIQQVKGSKFPIGSGKFYKKKSFETHALKVQEGDIYYLFTDGFPDQFGGETGGKFMVKRFRNFLLEYSYLTMAEQEEMLARAFKKWKGKRKQTDDILVIGIKI